MVMATIVICIESIKLVRNALTVYNIIMITSPLVVIAQSILKHRKCYKASYTM